MSCRVDAGSVGDLPQQAMNRAQREHARFAGQTQKEQQAELAGLAQMKRFVLAVEICRAMVGRGANA